MIMQNIMPESIHSFNNSKSKSKATEAKSNNTDIFSDIMNESLNKNSKTTQDSKSNQIESRKDTQDNFLVNEVNAKKETVISTNVTEIKESENLYSNSDANVNSLTQTKVKGIKASLDQLQTKMQSTLDLTTEEFEQLLENLGFSMFDLLNPDNMKQFVLQANGSGDITSVLTDEKLAESMNQLLQMVNEINQDITLPKELVEELLAKDSTTIDNVEATNNNSNVESDKGINAKVIIVNQEESLSSITNVDAILNNQAKNSDTMDALTQNNTSQTMDAVNQNNTLFDSNLNSNMNSNSTNAVYEKEQLATSSMVQITEEENKSLNQNAKVSTDSIINNASNDIQTTTYNMSDDNSLAQNNSSLAQNYNSLSNETNTTSGTNLLNKEQFDLELTSEKDSDINTQLDGYLNNLVNLSLNNTLNPEASIESISNFKEIVNQIVEQIKIVINSEQTSMEMQLNPESLGKINLSLISKDGILTAHFTTQNEVTKEAIESQMQILKDNLNNQGLKVESIEVTVSNFEFSQNNQTSANENQRNNSQNKGFIHFDEDLESNNNEDITLLNDLMEQMGSSVSYTV